MKYLPTIIFFGVLCVVLLFSGCTSTSPAVQTQTPVPVVTSAATLSTPTPTLSPAPVLFPGALAMNEYVPFGSGDEQGNATIYRYEVKPYYNWTSPTWNSPAEQAAASRPFEMQRGYNLEKPQAGNTFLFVYIRVLGTSSKSVYAPSAKQFVVVKDGKEYNYSSVMSSDVSIDNITGIQYDYLIGKGGTGGYVLPGESNKAEGYLIYEIPTPFSPNTTFVAGNLDFQTRAVWRLG